MILPKDSLVSSGCPIVQSKGLVIAMLMFKEVGKTVYAAKRVWMLMPEHLLAPRQRLSVHRLRLFVLAWLSSTSAKLFILVSVCGCSCPSTFSLSVSVWLRGRRLGVR
jgi:hypothetical protein